MEKITILTVSHNLQRYETYGDWITETEGSFPGTVQIYVSRTGDERFEFLIAIHELIEWFLAKQRFRNAKAVTEFDKQFELNRDKMEKEGIFEPGDHPLSPVFFEHQFASAIERLVAHELHVEWRIYEQHLDQLSRKDSPR